LIVLDINMPGMGGVEFYGKISTEYGRTKYPILVLTARANLEETFRDIEIDGFMIKPFEIDSFVKEVDRLSSGHVNPVIFLVDFKENPNVRQMMEALRKERYDVINVEDFGTLKSKAEERKPNFIVLEYMQKEMAGDKFIETIKAVPLLSDVPLIVYSYTGFKEYEDKSLQAGADKYLGKPEDGRDLLRAIKELKMERRIQAKAEVNKSRGVK
jgi:DNA-binding response OmpR family regulator